MNIKNVLDAAPPTPSCFQDRQIWSEYLLSNQRYSKSRVLPFVNGIFNPEWSFCKDCTRPHAEQMALAGNCNPNKYRVLILNKEIA